MTANILLGAVGLLLTILVAVAKDNIEVRRILAWFVCVIITLLLPGFLILWLTMRVAASVLSSTVLDLSAFTWQVSWWTGSLGMIYPLGWGCWLYPKLRLYIEEKILVDRKPQSKKSSRASKINQKS